MSPKFKKLILRTMVAGASLCLIVMTGTVLYLGPQLPSVEILKDYKLETPLRIYTSDGKLIEEFGGTRRIPVKIDQVPPLFVKAVLAAEDDRFESHHGVDPKGLMRAVFELLTNSSRQSGGSTITMQVARNYLITNERTFNRKFKEILLSLQIERELSKDEILELYFNKIFLGNKAYGFQAAAHVYYNTDIKNLELAQLAMLAAIPQAPSTGNPLANPDRALKRRNWILGRMERLGYIDEATAKDAIAKPIAAAYHPLKPEVEARYLAEMVRLELLGRYTSDEVYSSGMKAYTTIRSDLQAAANTALLNGLIDYDIRHGYRGPEATHELDSEDPLTNAQSIIEDITSVGPLRPAIVLSVDEKSVSAMSSEGEIEIRWQGMAWARPYNNANSMGARPKKAADILKVGDQIRIARHPEEGWQLSQIPLVQGALVSINPNDGGIVALVGGFSYQQSKWNRVVQMKRQPGSNIKPFIYSAALESGYTAASIINDAPIAIEDDLPEGLWRPENDDGKFLGPLRLRQALYRSRNTVSVRLLWGLTLSKAVPYLSQFFPSDRLERGYLSLALGALEFTPLEIAAGYASFANGGFKVTPYAIKRVEDINGNTIFEETPFQVCRECETAQENPNNQENPDIKEEAPSLDNGTGGDNYAEQQLQAALEAELRNHQADNSRTTGSGAEKTPPEKLELAEIKLPKIERMQLIAPRVIEARTAYIMDSILKDVIKRGTGTDALVLKRGDIAGKTGTTQDSNDAWFSGYSPNLVTTAWVGFDLPDSLGRYEYGGRAALPIWIDFMRAALAGTPETYLPQPPGIISVRIDPETGLRASPGHPDAVFEIFKTEQAPSQGNQTPGINSPYIDSEKTGAEEIF